MLFVSNNITLTGLSAADEADITACMQDKEISENTIRIPYPYTAEHARLWIEDNLIFEEENGYRRNYAIRNEEGRLLGCIGLHFNYGINADKSEIGYWLGKPYRNRGIMTEAIKQLALIAKERHGMKSLEAHVFDGNAGSQMALLKAGFVNTDRVQGMHQKNGKKIDAVKFVLML